VPCGTFYRTYSPDPDSGVFDPASVSAFRLDKYDVTVGRFRQFVNAVLPADGGAGWRPAPGSGKHTHLNGGLGLVDIGAAQDAGAVYEPGWVASNDSSIAPTDGNLSCNAAYDSWTSTPGSQESLPILCANWAEAYAFCIWDSGFLPTEAEWEYAAAGGDQQRSYPWGATDPGTASQYAIYGDGTGDCYYPSGFAVCSGPGNIAPVGVPLLGAGRWGQIGLEGNASIWALDMNWNYLNPCVDCVNATGGYNQVDRGGNWLSAKPNLISAQRGGGTPTTTRANTLGFRCGRTP
jgi:formylglycine-generating enzyme required for sulfatase activity